MMSLTSLVTSMRKVAGDTFDLLQVALHGLDAIGLLSKLPVTSDRHFEALTAISSIVGAIRDGFTGKVDVKTIEDHITAMHAAVLKNDEHVDRELDKRFPR